jgi:hypothetical protein
MPRVRFAAVLLPLTPALAGCSSSTPATDPAGTVEPLDPEAEGMVFDPVTGLLAVALRHPNRLVLLDATAGSGLRCRCPATRGICSWPRPAAPCSCRPRTRTRYG